ncbi:hypothetical protein CERZMDRAFT_30950 [Cercospora zeae-maydis SCOH1-5]|uniref:Uncharacterized protein n=1 Tax=Cercospora zeae-maydis SCOH1-5 TaxID=717836 RepID=A0A6A6FXG8_9PEZI|nr:hypothetical protein CERZMDRAFT_30950 [Cercospora zeae-maydis SCOH1-5]
MCCSAGATKQPCADIAGRYRTSHANTSSNPDNSFDLIPGQLALDCLRTMPFNSTLATAFIDAYRPYLLFHSTLDVLREEDPPPGYLSPSIDLLAGLGKIRRRAASGAYESHYDFDWELNRLLSLAHDGHLQIRPCSLGLFSFTRDQPLVSVSDDGLQLPSIYTLDDAQRREAHPLHSVSPIREINGMNAAYYLESNVAMWLDSHDPDARYNHVFPSAAARLAEAYPGGAWARYRGLWPGTGRDRLAFANGSHTTVGTYASWSVTNGPMIYETGSDLFAAACLPTSTSTLGREMISEEPLRDASRVALMYTEAEMKHTDTPVKVYYLPSARFSNVAVLQVPSFSLNNGISSYINITQHFLQRLVTQGKTKLIIDLSDNNGGDVDAGFSLFRLLFADQDVYSATRFRANDLVQIMGQIFFRYLDPGKAPVDLALLPQNAFDPAQKHAFRSWDTLYGPDDSQDANMSHLFALLAFNATSVQREMGSIAKSQSSFKAQDTVMLTNGRCSSTCALFAQQLSRHGVGSVTFGGRPRHGSMQAVRGNKGAQYWSIATIGRYIALAHELAINATRTQHTAEDEDLLAKLETLMPPLPGDFPLRFDLKGQSGINFRNSYDEDDDQTPRQFKYQAAHCRRFFTLENIFQPESIWIDAAEAVFGEAHCVGT